MPEWMSKPQEKDFKESVDIVKDEKEKPKGKFKDRDWGLVMHIWKNKEKAHRGKQKRKQKGKKSFVLMEELAKIASKLQEAGLDDYALQVGELINFQEVKPHSGLFNVAFANVMQKIISRGAIDDMDHYGLQRMLSALNDRLIATEEQLENLMDHRDRIVQAPESPLVSKQEQLVAVDRGIGKLQETINTLQEQFTTAQGRYQALSGQKWEVPEKLVPIGPAGPVQKRLDPEDELARPMRKEREPHKPEMFGRWSKEGLNPTVEVEDMRSGDLDTKELISRLLVQSLRAIDPKLDPNDPMSKTAQNMVKYVGRNFRKSPEEVEENVLLEPGARYVVETPGSRGLEPTGLTGEKGNAALVADLAPALERLNVIATELTEQLQANSRPLRIDRNFSLNETRDYEKNVAPLIKQYRIRSAQPFYERGKVRPQDAGDRVAGWMLRVPMGASDHADQMNTVLKQSFDSIAGMFKRIMDKVQGSTVRLEKGRQENIQERPGLRPGEKGVRIRPQEEKRKPFEPFYGGGLKQREQAYYGFEPKAPSAVPEEPLEDWRQRMDPGAQRKTKRTRRKRKKKSEIQSELLSKLAARRRKRNDPLRNIERGFIPGDRGSAYHQVDVAKEMYPELYKQKVETPTEEVMESRRQEQDRYKETMEEGVPVPMDTSRLESQHVQIKQQYEDIVNRIEQGEIEENEQVRDRLQKLQDAMLRLERGMVATEKYSPSGLYTQLERLMEAHAKLKESARGERGEDRDEVKRLMARVEDAIRSVQDRIQEHEAHGIEEGVGPGMPSGAPTTTLPKPVKTPGTEKATTPHSAWRYRQPWSKEIDDGRFGLNDADNPTSKAA